MSIRITSLWAFMRMVSRQSLFLRTTLNKRVEGHCLRIFSIVGKFPWKKQSFFFMGISAEKYSWRVRVTHSHTQNSRMNQRHTHTDRNTQNTRTDTTVGSRLISGCRVRAKNTVQKSSDTFQNSPQFQDYLQHLLKRCK